MRLVSKALYRFSFTRLKSPHKISLPAQNSIVLPNCRLDTNQIFKKISHCNTVHRYIRTEWHWHKIRVFFYFWALTQRTHTHHTLQLSSQTQKRKKYFVLFRQHLTCKFLLFRQGHSIFWLIFITFSPTTKWTFALNIRKKY